MIDLIDITGASADNRQAFRQVLRDSTVTKDGYFWIWREGDPRIQECKDLWDKHKQDIAGS